MAAAKLAQLSAGRPPSSSANLPNSVITQATAAAGMNVSTRGVGTARRILERGVPELVGEVEAGRVSVNTAAVVALMPEGEQQALVQQGPKAIRKAVKSVVVKKKNRVVDSTDGTILTGSKERSGDDAPEHEETITSATEASELEQRGDLLAGPSDPQVSLATEKSIYRHEDDIGEWLNVRVKNGSFGTRVSELYTDYITWSDSQGKPHMTLPEFSISLGRDYEKAQAKPGIYVIGVRLR
jgi:hypothetical protein